MNAIKRVISPQQQLQQKHYAVKVNHDKETHKGLDIKLDSNTHLLPSLGNNQDLKFSIIGKIKEIFYLFINKIFLKGQNGVALVIQHAIKMI